GVDVIALRAQDVDSINGKLLRIDPATGNGLPDNPFYAGPTDIPSKVWCYGFRNPFRFTILPGTSDVFVGDVGWDDWEELDVAARGGNYGWPCHEGPFIQPRYDAAFPSSCTAGSIPPAWTYDHEAGGAAISAVGFLAGANYPPE